ncbi:hypothetical protein BB559_005331 [Furculomyces boomerangus]|uniref:Myosin-1 n=2 Tax=Harpellales TaxID=61421 RepID=A0A2T9Y973_9FUNG|nr:hypothetical protein BB559_005331 [Furculomyces boomerangus]
MENQKPNPISKFNMHPLSQFRRDYPTFSEPSELSYFSIDSNRNIVNDDSALSLFSPNKTPMGADLSEGYESWIKKDSNVVEHLDNLLNHVSSLLLSGIDIERYKANIYSYRGMITKIMCTPYSSKDSWNMNIVRHKGTIFIEEYKTEEDKEKNSDVSDSQKHMMYSGYKFEQLYTESKESSLKSCDINEDNYEKYDGSDDLIHKSAKCATSDISDTDKNVESLVDGDDNPSNSASTPRKKLRGNREEVVNNNVEYCSVYTVMFEKLRIIMGAEIDCIEGERPDSHPNRKYVELKTSKEINNERDKRSFERYKLLKYWAQSYLAGISKIFVGFRDPNLILRGSTMLNTHEIPRMVRGGKLWDPRVCLNFAFKVLSWVCKTINTDDPNIVYRLKYNPDSGTAKGKAFNKATWADSSTRKKQAGVSDMTLLSKITNEEISENLKKRFQNAEIYTYIGNVLISVNPFKDLGIYTPEIIKSYQGKNKLELAPHVYAIAEGSFKNMISYRENQCVIISGESGAGKTEAAKRILEYIAVVSGESSSSIQKVKEMTLATSPLLEGFGNAKTLRNNNSSRHGKYLEVQFNTSGEPTGAKITNYLLEKSRVVSQIKNERNFHIFYQITKAVPQKYRDMFGISKPEDFKYTSAAGCINVNNIDDVSDYNEVMNAMNIIGLSSQEQEGLLCLLSAILWLGNVEFIENENSESKIANPDVVDFISYLIQTDSALLTSTLETRIIETVRSGRRGSIYNVPLNRTQAIAARDGLAMAIYTRMFDWIVSRVNSSLEATSTVSNQIGVLDIYGFEIFDKNSFEQLCINYVNEKLQQIFIELTLKTEQEEYVREQIVWTPIDYFNNKVVCDLIESRRPPGLFATMNDAVATAHADSTAADNSLKQRLSSMNSKYFELRDVSFTVKHYAGNVTYDISGMTDKNKDQLLRDHLNLCTNSSNRFLAGLFNENDMSENKKRPPTASDRIKTSANDLVVKLSNSQPSYVRTIKPNENKSSTEYDERRVLHQVKYLGLCENIRVRRAGFAYRQTFDKFVERFYLLSGSTSYAGEYTWKGDTKTACAQIFRDTNISREEWQMGVTKTFIRHPETLWALENMREKYWYNMAVRIQRAWRRYMAYKNECARKIQTAYRKNKNNLMYVQTRNYGHRLLDGRKERRRFSLVSYRTYFGDYLNVNHSQSGQGSITRSTLKLGSNDRVVFSGNVDFLVSRQMRSAKPAPRIFVLTNQYIYIISQTVERGLYKQTLEQKAALVSISKISLSPLQDGWTILIIDQVPSFVFRSDMKTEILTHLMMLTNGRIQLSISPQLEYYNKKMKLCKLQFSKNESAKFEAFNSKSVVVASGMPPNSESNPPARRLQSQSFKKVVNQVRKTPAQTTKTPKTQPTYNNPPPRQNNVAPQLKMPDAGDFGIKQGSFGQQKAVQPAMQMPQPRVSQNQETAKPNLNTQLAQRLNQNSRFSNDQSRPQNSINQSMANNRPSNTYQRPAVTSISQNKPQNINMNLITGQEYEVLEKNPNGWWFAKNSSGQSGWIPSNYLDPVPRESSQSIPRPSTSSYGNSASQSNYGGKVNMGSTQSSGQYNQVNTDYNSRNSSGYLSKLDSQNTAVDNDSMAKLAAALAEWPSSPDKLNGSGGNRFSGSGNKIQGGNNSSNKMAGMDRYSRPNYSNTGYGQNSRMNQTRHNNDSDDDEEAWN